MSRENISNCPDHWYTRGLYGRLTGTHGHDHELKKKSMISEISGVYCVDDAIKCGFFYHLLLSFHF